MNGIIEFTPQVGAVTTPGAMQQQIDLIWWRLFDVPGAVATLDNHLATLGGDGTLEQHTRKAYESSLRYFFNWAAGSPLKPGELRKLTVYEMARLYPAHRFPGPGLLGEYVAHYKRLGRAKSTIDRHMAPVRLYLKALGKQYIPAKGDTRQIVDDCRHWMAMALDTKVPASESYNNTAALYQHGTRLTVAQVDSIFQHLAAQDGLMAARDLAVMYLGFNAALRDAEIRRVTLNSIRQGTTSLEIVVRGKRNNRAPVPLDATGHALIMRWVAAYNEDLSVDDPRYIAGDVPVFQPLQKGDGHRAAGVAGYDPARGLGKGGLQVIVKRCSLAGCGVEISPHDMRRTAAAIGRLNGMDFDVLQVLLRHKSIATTQRYVGNPPDLSKSLLSNRVNWSISVA